jgi:hypothetical protein
MPASGVYRLAASQAVQETGFSTDDRDGDTP